MARIKKNRHLNCVNCGKAVADGCDCTGTPGPKIRKGDRVRDRYKLPRPGDECMTGTVVGILQRERSNPGWVIEVEWDDGPTRWIVAEVLEVIRDDNGE